MLTSLEELDEEDITDAKDQIQTLLTDLRFLKTFANCISRDENLKRRSTNAIAAYLSSSLPEETTEVNGSEDIKSQVSFASQVFEKMRSIVSYFYGLISVTSQSYVPMTYDLVKELINDLMQNLKDLLRSKANWMVTIKSQISALNQRLQFLMNFLDFVAKRCSEHEKFRDLLGHIEVLAINAAPISYFCLADQQTEESIHEIKYKLSNLLDNITPLKAEVREIYNGVLEATKSSASSDSCMKNRHGLEAFLDSLNELLLEIRESGPRLKLLAHDQLKEFGYEFRFIRILLIDPPRQPSEETFEPLVYSGPENLNDLLRSIEALTIESGSLIFSLFSDEITEDFSKQMNLVLVDLLKRMKCITLCIERFISTPQSRQGLNFPKLMDWDLFSSFLENLKELLSHKDNSVALLKHHIETVQKELESLIPLLKNMEGWLNHNEEFKSLWIEVLDLAYHAEYVIGSFVMKDGPAWYYMLWLDDVVNEIQLIKADIIKINSQKPSDTGVHHVINSSSSAPFSFANSPTTDVRLVGFENEVETLTDLLIKGSGNNLDIISIVGMPGLGKTTLSRTLYNSVLVEKHFHVRAWCCISQVYQKKDLLLSILGQVIELREKHYKMDEDDLASLLKKRLMVNRYLVVIDDIWNIEAWRDLQLSFPDNNQGSRIMFTTRIFDVALQAKLHSNPHSLRLFNDEESWDLLQELVFSKESCPLELLDIGKQIATSCKGLPLSVALTAGLLATDKTRNFWRQVKKRFTSRTIGDEQTQTLDIIDLSYKHLPNHLKPCLLYFGAFLEDQEISVKKLIKLWIAEGFVRKAEGKRIEETAENLLKDLIGRSLVTIARHRADGGIKACRIHDLLFHFCSVKAKEEDFWQLIDGYDDLLPSNVDYDISSNFLRPSTPTYEQYRLCIYSKRNQFVMSMQSGSHVRSLFLIAAKDCNPVCRFDLSFIFNNFKLLRVLNLVCLRIKELPSGLELLVQLKYLALWVGVERFPSSIGDLWNLETLVLKMEALVFIPYSIWKMRKLRHLHVSRFAILNTYEGFIHVSSSFEETDFSCQDHCLEDTDQLNNLQTISTLAISDGRKGVFRKIPNIRKLSCGIFDPKGGTDHSHFPALELLNNLESVNVSFLGLMSPPLLEISFPSQLKRLTFSAFELQWEAISIIGRLENLEVLKLREHAFTGPLWDMKVGEFPKLKHLELCRMDLEEWNASFDNFPCRRQLRLISCSDLKNVPCCLAEVETLEMIEVKWCPELDMETIQEIEEEQKDNGNIHFKTYIVQTKDEDTDAESSFNSSSLSWL